MLQGQNCQLRFMLALWGFAFAILICTNPSAPIQKPTSNTSVTFCCTASTRITLPYCLASCQGNFKQVELYLTELQHQDGLA